MTHRASGVQNIIGPTRFPASSRRGIDGERFVARGFGAGLEMNCKDGYIVFAVVLSGTAAPLGQSGQKPIHNTGRRSGGTLREKDPQLLVAELLLGVVHRLGDSV